MNSVKLIDGRYRVRGHFAGVMLAVSAVAFAGTVALALQSPAQHAQLIALVAVSLCVLMVLAVIRMWADGCLRRQIVDLLDRQGRIERLHKH